MTERRPFPPSPRRLALARQAGLTSASPLVVGAIACGAAVLAAVFLARAAASLVGNWIAAACRAADGSRSLGDVTQGVDASTLSAGRDGVATLGLGGHDRVATLGLDRVATLGLEGIVAHVVELAGPIIAAAAIAAVVAHVAQTRSLWLPRRRIAGAPIIEPARVHRTAFDISAAIVIGVVAFGWLWITAPRLASLFVVDTPLLPVGSGLASLIVALAVAWISMGVVDALLRHVELTTALAMTITEKREDDRLSAADPRWRAQRTALMRGPSASSAVARAALVLLGDDVAVAIAWDARRQPVPLRTITGRRAHATQLLGLARRHRVPVHRDAQLAAALVDGEGPIPDTHWARLADIIAAVQSANTGRDVSR
jgi:flagellar biosynthesis protein FlhB